MAKNRVWLRSKVGGQVLLARHDGPRWVLHHPEIATKLDKLFEETERMEGSAAAGQTDAGYSNRNFTLVYDWIPAGDEPESTSSTAGDYEPNAEPLYPEVIQSGDRFYLRVGEDRDYALPSDPRGILALIFHLSQKTWVDGEFVNLALGRIAVRLGIDLSL